MWGTRPEAIKIGPVVAELRSLGIQPKLISTGQHWDLLRGTPAESDLCDSESLGLPANGDPLQWVRDAVPKIVGTLQGTGPVFVVVQGDTASALAGAYAARAVTYPLMHIEAGVRSGDWGEPYPEESFRREITRLADWHYAPTPHCVDNLLTEGIPEDRIILTGNPVVSALARYADVQPQPPQPHIVLTMHRREWLERTRVALFLGDVEHWCRKHPALTVIWPVHPAVWNRWPADWEPHVENLQIGKPLPYQEAIQLLSTAQGLATDSGGLVEEATTLGIPTAILRNSNDRPEAVTAGIARQFSPTDLETAFTWLTQDHPRNPSNIYGSPDSAPRIAQHLATLVS